MRVSISCYDQLKQYMISGTFNVGIEADPASNTTKISILAFRKRVLVMLQKMMGSEPPLIDRKKCSVWRDM